jgi:nickel-dependent lactate racemase
VAFSRAHFAVRLGRTFDVAIAGVPAPKGANLYQASRAATYLALAGESVLAPGAPIIIHAPCNEGAGLGTGELAFYQLIASAASPDDLLEKAKKAEWRGGEQRALIIARALKEHPIIVAGAENPTLVRECKMTPAADVDAAIRIARAKFGPAAHAVVVPDPFTMLPAV